MAFKNRRDRAIGLMRRLGEKATKDGDLKVAFRALLICSIMEGHLLVGKTKSGDPDPEISDPIDINDLLRRAGLES